MAAEAMWVLHHCTVNRIQYFTFLKTGIAWLDRLYVFIFSLSMANIYLYIKPFLCVHPNDGITLPPSYLYWCNRHTTRLIDVQKCTKAKSALQTGLYTSYSHYGQRIFLLYLMRRHSPNSTILDRMWQECTFHFINWIGYHHSTTLCHRLEWSLFWSAHHSASVWNQIELSII